MCFVILWSVFIRSMLVKPMVIWFVIWMFVMFTGLMIVKSIKVVVSFFRIVIIGWIVHCFDRVKSFKNILVVFCY